MSSTVAIHDDLFTEDEYSLDYLYRFFKQCNSNWQFDFIPKEEVEGNTRTLAYKQHVRCLISQVMPHVDIDHSKVKGYEVWINNMPKDSKGLEYHYDCDEGQDELVTPLKSIVIYLGPKAGMTGGSLALDIVGRHKKKEFNSIYEVAQDLEHGWIQVPFLYGRTTIFNPMIPHAVLPIKRIDPWESRITITIAVWDKEPSIIRSSR